MVTIFLILIVVATLWYLCKSTDIASKEPLLRVGIIGDYAPYAYVNPDGSYEGYDIDIATIIGTKMNRQVKFYDMKLEPLLIGLQQKSIDIVLSGLTITKARQEVMTMIYYQGEPSTYYTLAFWKQVPNNVQSIDDIITQNSQAIICVEPGSVQESFLTSAYPALSLCRLSTISDIVLELSYDKAYAALLDPQIVPALRTMVPDLALYNIQLPEEYQSPGCGIALAKDSLLAQSIKQIIQKLINDGTLAELEQKWFNRSKDIS